MKLKPTQGELPFSRILASFFFVFRVLFCISGPFYARGLKIQRKDERKAQKPFIYYLRYLVFLLLFICFR